MKNGRPPHARFTSSIETLIRTTADAGRRRRTWRTAKWKGSPRFIRAAAAGLAAKDISTPMKISSATTPSIQRSTVHHHTPSGERSERAKAWAWYWRSSCGPALCFAGVVAGG